ncbi:MAG: S8 family serine peptidase [Sedimentisphaerales bacterium]|nr:S8 family serine peptidase [Sedimentisphaerales bacterium]
MTIETKSKNTFRSSCINMTRFFATVVLCLGSCVLGLIYPPASVAADDIASFTQSAQAQADYVADEVLITLDDEDAKTAEQAAAILGGTVRQRIRFPDSPHKRSHRQNAIAKKQVIRVKLPKGKNVEQAIAESRRAGIRVEPNYRVRILAVPNDPLFSYLWGLRNTGQTGGAANADIDAVSAWDITTGSDDVLVAVIDTGIDYTHPDLAANIWTNSGETAGNGIDDDGNGYIDDIHGYDFVENDGDAMDEHSHGTHCAGTIGASSNNGVGVTGVNWHCKIMACRFLDEDGSGTTADAISAINYAVTNGAQILSNSWGGGGYSSTLAAAITNAKNNGVLFVAAAGNDGVNTDSIPHYPSCYNISNVIAVAATTHSDSLASFSNYGSTTVHLGAPGASILSTVLGGEYEWYNGTSMATPHVSGVAALLLANNPTMSLNELKSRLIWTGDPIGSLANKTITGRRLNAYNALTAEPTLEVTAPNTQATWVQGFDWTIQWISIGCGETIDIYLLKAGAVYSQLANDTTNAGSYSWHIPGTIPVGSDYKIRIDDGVNSDDSDVNFTITDEPVDYFTEQFSVSTSRFDLANTSLLLTPDESDSRYSACVNDITTLPVDTSEGTRLNLDDDESAVVPLSSDSVMLYGESYDSIYVGSNGYITFGSADDEYSESLTGHFGLKRIAGLFRDLDPSDSGNVEILQLADRIAVTWNDVTEYGRSNSNTFQIELFYEGQIRLSWLSIDAEYGITGISEGLGEPPDLIQSDLSEYGLCDPMLQSIEVTGPETIEEQSTTQLACIAYYEDGSAQDITVSQAQWSVDSNYAVVDDTGLLTANDVDVYKQCMVTATFNGKSSSLLLIINDSNTHTITIEKAAVKAGKQAGLDSIICSGSFGITAGQLASADDVIIQIYSADDDYLVYEQTIDFATFSALKTGYGYKTRILSGQPGAINSLVFNVVKNKFYLKAKNINLKGLSCSFYVLLDAGDYVGLGIADETVVNGKKSIPVKLLSGYTDTLSVQKAKTKDSSKPLCDGLSVKGYFTVSDDSTVTDGVTITWGAQSFIIPGEQLLAVNAERFKSKYTAPDGVILNTDFDFAKCKFTIIIKKTTISAHSGVVDFTLAFGSYSQTEEVQIY